MKLFCVVFVVYLVVLTLFGVDGRGGGGSTKGLKEYLGTSLRARRHAPIAADEPPNGSVHTANGEPTTIRFRSRRNANQPENEPPQMTNEEPPPPPSFRQRRQLPPGIPAPPEGLPVPMLNQN